MYKILLVDDEPRTVDALEKNIDWHACSIRKVFKCDSMASAIELVKAEKPEIMICDIEMPNGSGLQLLEWLNDNQMEINCIFVTCHPEFEYMRKAIQLKCYDYILKPINYEEFHKVLKNLILKMEDEKNGSPQETKNWGGLTDGQIRELGRSEDERNVESEVKKYISDHMMDSISVTDIAEALHFNSQYLMRAFKKTTNMSIVEYITNLRMETAKKILVDTNLPVKEVSGMVGYSDYAYFNRVFKKEVGVSPNQYRADKK